MYFSTLLLIICCFIHNAGINADAFRILLKYVYTGIINLNNLKVKEIRYL